MLTSLLKNIRNIKGKIIVGVIIILFYVNQDLNNFKILKIDIIYYL